MSTIGKHNGTVMRISPEGESAEVLGYGFRSPYLGVHPVTGLSVKELLDRLRR